MADRQFLEQMVKKLADEGKLVEAGWVSFRLHCMHPQAPADQVQEMHLAFMAGAQHLFGSIMGGTLDEDREPTEADMRRMDLIHQELEEFAAVLQRRMQR